MSALVPLAPQMGAFLPLALALLAGALVKLVDDIVDERLPFSRVGAVLLGVLYGVLIAATIISMPAVASVYVAVLIGVLLSKKLDHPAHWAGVASVVLFLAIFGLPQIDLGLLALFVLASVADEKASDLADAGKLTGVAGTFSRYRLLLEFTVLAASWLTGRWEMFAGILLFDVGYLFTGSGLARFGR